MKTGTVCFALFDRTPYVFLRACSSAKFALGEKVQPGALSISSLELVTGI